MSEEWAEDLKKVNMRESAKASSAMWQNKRLLKEGDDIHDELDSAVKTGVGERSPDDKSSIKELYRLAGLPVPENLDEDVTSDQLDEESEEGDPDSEDVVKKTTGKPMVKPFDEKQKTPTFSDEYGRAGEPTLSWVDEVRIRAQQILPAYDPQVILDTRHRLNEIEGRKISTVYEASFNYSAGTMIAELLPDFKTPNVNGFYLHPSLKKKLLEKLNSGRVFLKDSHSRAIKDIIGIVTRGIESKDGKILIKSDVTDPKISEILKKYPTKLGVSLNGNGTGYCTECGAKVTGMQRCPNHPKASIEVRAFDLKEVSLCEDPAWQTSKVKSYGTDE